MSQRKYTRLCWRTLSSHPHRNITNRQYPLMMRRWTLGPPGLRRSIERRVKQRMIALKDLGTITILKIHSLLKDQYLIIYKSSRALQVIIKKKILTLNWTRHLSRTFSTCSRRSIRYPRVPERDTFLRRLMKNFQFHCLKRNVLSPPSQRTVLQSRSRHFSKITKTQKVTILSSRESGKCLRI